MPGSGTLRRRAWLLLAASIALQIALHQSAQRLKRHDTATAEPHLHRRSIEPDQFFSLPYADYYFASSPILRPFIAVGYLLILAFLFSFIGISASDFFCPNLSTIATVLGLNESTAGVTFLAFGNGSPDVFSTFSALKGGTFSLAIGELIGAASFIISIVVGSIALIRPFHVKKHAFMRDVLFFTTAVLVLIWALHDGHLTWRESSGMVLLYATYVGVVVAGNWAARRRRRKREAAELAAWNRDIAAAGEDEQEDGPGQHPGDHQHDVLPNLHIPPATLAKRSKPSAAAGPPAAAAALSHTTPTASSSRTSSLNGSPHLLAARGERRASRAVSAQLHLLLDHDDDDYGDSGPRANFSLLGAIEFRDVVNSLRKPSGSHPSSPLATPRRSGSRPAKEGDYFAAAARPSHRRSVSAVAPRSPDGGLHSLHHPVVPGRKRASSHLPLPESRQLASLRAEEAPKSVPRQGSAPAVPQTIEFHQVEPNVWQDQAGRPPTPSAQGNATKPDRLQVLIPSSRRDSLADSDTESETPTELPTISVTDPQGIARQETFSSGIETRARLEPVGPRRPGESRYRIRTRTRQVLRVLFPSLQSFRHKSIVGMVMAVVSVPAILALTVTLPVVDDGRSDEGGIALPEGDDEPLHERVPGQGEHAEETDDDEDDPNADERCLTPEIGEELHHLVEGGFSPMRSPLGRISHTKLRRALHDEEERIRSHAAGSDTGAAGGSSTVGEDNGSEGDDDEDEMTKELVEDIRQEEVLEFNKYLAAAQCVLGPLFCVWIVFGETNALPWILLGTGVGGLAAGTVVIKRGTDGREQPWRVVRCFCGFICSMVWIAAIADEVVSVLQAIGEILGLSDAIIGLTIGNSLADLVANVTVAQFAPAMAYAACFGGPMLNLLLGVGGSGTYHILAITHKPVKIDFSPTLWVSAAGLVLMLVATAIVVPMNGYLIDRRWAGCLIVAYLALMITNVIVEVKTGRG